MSIHVHSSTAHRSLAVPRTFPEALDVQPPPSSFLSLLEFRSSCCRAEAPCSCRRPAESGCTPAGAPRCLFCSPGPPGSSQSCPSRPSDVSSSPASRQRPSPRAHEERLPTWGAQMTLHHLECLCRVFLSLSTTQPQVQKKQGLSVFGGHDSTGLVPIDRERKSQG